MKRLRHPVRAVREPFGTAGLIVACIALVLGCTGAAFAAAKLNSTQKKEVEKIAKKFAGKPGAPGAQGAVGPQGPAGPAGANGKDGTNGTNGTNGTSVTTSSFGGNKTVGSVHCEEGGVEVKSASPATAVCNGAAAAGGGFPETLPSGATETGAWSITTVEGFDQTAISFPIPLELGLGKNEAIFLKQGEGETEECPGTAEAPEAKAGYLCVYAGQLGGSEPFTLGGSSPIVPPTESVGEPGGTGTSGAIIGVSTGGAGEYINGTWALTAPEA